MYPANRENMSEQGIKFAYDGSIINQAMEDINNNCQYYFLFKAATVSEQLLENALDLAIQVRASLNTNSLCAIWNVLNQMEQVPGTTISPTEAQWRKKDLDLDIRDFYANGIRKCEHIIKDLRTPSMHGLLLKCINKRMGKCFNLLLNDMNDLDERISILMHLINPTAVNMFTILRVNRDDQLRVINGTALLIIKRLKLKTAVKNDIENFRRLNRRMHIFIGEVELTKLSGPYLRRYDHIKRITESSTEDLVDFRRIVSDMQTLEEEIAECNSVCKMKCLNFEQFFNRAIKCGESTNDYCNKKICGFISDVYDYFKEIFEQYRLFSDRLERIKTNLFPTALNN